MLRASLLFLGASSVSAYTITPGATRSSIKPRCASPVAIDLPKLELPSLPSLPSLSLPEPPEWVERELAPLKDLVAYKPVKPTTNKNTFDKDGRLIKGPAVGLVVPSQVTRDNRGIKK